MEHTVETLREVLLEAFRFKGGQSKHNIYQSAARIGAASLLLKHFGSKEVMEQAGIIRQLEYLWRELDQPLDLRERFATAWLELHAKELGLVGTDFSIDNLDPIVAELAFITMSNRAIVGFDPVLAR